MRKINRIVIHCSDSEFGNARLIDQWHRSREPRPFKCIGYHYVVTNGQLLSTSKYSLINDGILETGRPVRQVGAHCKGFNKYSIGICLVGTHHFTLKQFHVLTRLVEALQGIYNIPDKMVQGHNELNPYKTCPNFPIDYLKGSIL